MIRRYLLPLLLIVSVVVNVYVIWNQYKLTAKGTELVNANTNMALMGLLNTKESLRACKQQGWAESCSLWKVGQGLEKAVQSSREVTDVAQLADRKTEEIIDSIHFTDFWTELYEIQMSLEPQIQGRQQGKSLDTNALDRLLTRIEQADFPPQVQVAGWESVRKSIKQFMESK